MLVLSRKKLQRVVFPNLGISVSVVRISGNSVRIGVEAPRDVAVLRGELVDQPLPAGDQDKVAQRRHERRNRLNTATLALHVLQKHLELGRYEQAQKLLESALEAFSEVERAIDCESRRTSSNSKGGHRALVVEDNANERELLTGYLNLCGYQVESVENGIDAMDYLARHHVPDVVLLDMHMPGMDGPQTVSAIRCDPRYRHVKLFAISGSQPTDIDVPLGGKGIDRWFLKPLKPDEFASELKTELEEQCVVA